MGIKAARGPAGGEEAVGIAYSAMTPGPESIFRSEEGGSAPGARIREPIPIYSVDLQILCEKGVESLSEARRTGWRYVIEHDSGLEVVDLPDEGDRAPELLAGGEVGENLAKSGRKAARIADGAVDYEPRILDLNLIGNSVLWLHSSKRPSKDRFISLANNPSELKPDALIKRIRNSAERKLSAMAGAGDEGGG